jgi:hypothetical protein
MTHRTYGLAIDFSDKETVSLAGVYFRGERVGLSADGFLIFNIA